MEPFETLAEDSNRIAPLIEKTLRRKYHSVPPEEIGIAVSEAVTSYCMAVRVGTLHEDDNAAGYMWRVGKRAISKYLKHRIREPLITEHEYQVKVQDNATEEFERIDTNDVILSLIENVSYHEMLELHLRQELSFEEIAEKQGRTVKAVYHCYERALHRAQEIAWELGVRDDPPPATTAPENLKNNLKIFQKWWGKNWGIGIYTMSKFCLPAPGAGPWLNGNCYFVCP